MGVVDGANPRCVFYLEPKPLRVGGEEALAEENWRKRRAGGQTGPIGHRYGSLRLPRQHPRARCANQRTAVVSVEQEKSGRGYRIPMAASVPVPLRNSQASQFMCTCVRSAVSKLLLGFRSAKGRGTSLGAFGAEKAWEHSSGLLADRHTHGSIVTDPASPRPLKLPLQVY
jgi:hypothetical protein